MNKSVLINNKINKFYKKIIAEGSPSELMNNKNAKQIYFGDAFKLS